MSDKKKNINENSMGGGGIQGSAGAFFRIRRKRRSKNPGAPFGPAGYGIIFPKKKGPKKGKDVKDFKNGKVVKSETLSESILRDSIRNLIFLNRVKYHEEQVLREMQEQKLRKIIRYVLNESDDAVAKNLDTTGQTSAYKWLQKIEKTTFENSFVSLVTSRRQRRAFQEIYLTGVKIYLDALDEKYFILNPGKRQPAPGQPQISPAAAPVAGAAAAQLAEQEVHPAAEPVAKSIQSSNDSIQSQAITSAVAAAGYGSIESSSDYEDIRSAVNMAKECLKQDLAQLDDLYFDLSLTRFTTSKGRETNDREDFRKFLIGEKNNNGNNSLGNVQVNFIKYNKGTPITNVFPNDIPEEGGQQDDTPLLDLPGKGAEAGLPPLEQPPAATGGAPPELDAEPPTEPPPEGEEEQEPPI